MKEKSNKLINKMTMEDRYIILITLKILFYKKRNIACADDFCWRKPAFWEGSDP